MSRSSKIAKAASLPKGSPERREILAELKEAGRPKYHNDPNVSLGSIVYNASTNFAEDVAKAVLRYSSLNTPVKNLSGYTHTRRGIAMGSIVNRTVEPERILGVEVRVLSAGKGFTVTLTDADDQNGKTFRFPDHETPSAVGAGISHVGEKYLMPQ